MDGPVEPGWELYRSFLAALSAGSLSGAARALRLTQPTIGRHIDELEKALGTVLFTRSQHGLQATDAAAALAPYAEAMASSAAALRRMASGHSTEVRGSVRLSASEVTGVEVLPPMLASLRRRHPQLVLELVISNQMSDLLRRDVDLAVRHVRPTQTGLIARKIGAVVLGLHAHRSYLEAHGSPRNLADHKGHALIGFDEETPTVRHLQEKGLPFTREMFALRTDNDLAHLAAIRAGLGIGVCQVPLGRRNPNLVRLLPRQFAYDMDVWLVMHENLRASPRMRAVFDHLAEGLAAYVAGKG
jgi:DNA-binding transcriptional LysR family regulator